MEEWVEEESETDFLGEVCDGVLDHALPYPDPNSNRLMDRDGVGR